MQASLSIEETRILKDFRSLLERRLGPVRLIVFGSRARRDHQDDSDLDVLVLVKEPLPPAVEAAVSDCAWEASFASGIVLVALVESDERWERGPQRASLLAEAIRREGLSV